MFEVKITVSIGVNTFFMGEGFKLQHVQTSCVGFFVVVVVFFS